MKEAKATFDNFGSSSAIYARSLGQPNLRGSQRWHRTEIYVKLLQLCEAEPVD